MQANIEKDESIDSVITQFSSIPALRPTLGKQEMVGSHSKILYRLRAAPKATLPQPDHELTDAQNNIDTNQEPSVFTLSATDMNDPPISATAISKKRSNSTEAKGNTNTMG